MTWIAESELQTEQAKIEQWFSETAVCDVLVTKDKVKLAYTYYVSKNATKALVLSAGRVESYLKYQALFYELVQQGFAVFSCDHRGQGLSQRMTNNPMQGHIDDFMQYRDDLAFFMQQIVQPQLGEKLPVPDLLCHSMGSAIGLLLVQQHPNWFNKVVLSAPMLGLVAPLPDWLAKLVLSFGLIGTNLLQKPLYFIGQKDFTPEPFATNKLTHSEIRYAIFRAQQEAYPDTQLGGVTYGWVAAAMQALYQIEQQATKTQTPILCISAGADRVVDNQAQARIMQKFPNGQMLTIADAYHELLFELDEYRIPTLQAMMNFLEE